MSAEYLVLAVDVAMLSGLRTVNVIGEEAFSWVASTDTGLSLYLSNATWKKSHPGSDRASTKFQAKRFAQESVGPEPRLLQG